MRIMQIIQKPQLRGAEIFACQLSNNLVEQGHEVKIVTVAAGQAQLPFRGEVIALNRPLKKRFFDITGWRILAAEIRKFKPDVVQANAGDTLKFAVFSKLVFRWKAKLVFRNANKISDFIDSKVKLLLNKFLVAQLDYVISVSELCRQDFQATFQFSDKRIACVPIGVNKQNTRGELPADVKQIYEGASVILHVGSFVREKNHRGLLNIFSRIAANNPNVRLVLVGEGPLMEETRNLAAAQGLASRVFFLGSRKDVHPLMSHASVLVLPSLIEGLPAVILEAFCAGTPVVAYNVGGIAEVVANQETGLLVSKGDESRFAEAVIQLLSQPALKQHVTREAFRLVETKFDNRYISERFLKIYQHITL